MRRIALGTVACLAAVSLHAAPMGFKDSWMGMADAGANWREVSANHAFTARNAVGAAAIWMRSDDKVLTRTLTELTWTHLARRWNLPHAQANLWLFAGAGALRGNDFGGAKAMVTPGLQLDYETTRVYLAATARLYRADAIRHDTASLRAGVSLYEVDYDEVQPWVVLEARRMRGLSDNTEITPMLRLIHNRFFVELGVNTDKQVRANLMTIF